MYKKSAFISVFSAGCNCSCAQCDEMSKQSTILSPDCTTGSSSNGALVFQCLVFTVNIPGKNKYNFLLA